MIKKFLAALFITVIIILFAVQNAEIISINILFWSFSISLAVILIICIFCGALVGVLFALISVKKKAEERKNNLKI